MYRLFKKKIGKITAFVNIRLVLGHRMLQQMVQPSASTGPGNS